MHLLPACDRCLARLTSSAVSRRGFAGLLLGLPVAARAADAPAAGRKLDFQIGEDFGDASPADIRAVLRSAAETLWEHCPNTRWEVPGFFIYHSRTAPITEYAHRPDGRIAIGLTSQGRLWSQFAFQFAHEFAHALAGHANDGQECWRVGRKANHWLEESLCETASLFALRAMGRRWAEQPPYPNWKSYAPALTTYAQQRLDTAALPPDVSFGKWIAEHEASLRQVATLRDKNLIVARQLLPLFEAHPAGWEAVTFANRTPHRDPEKTLARHFTDWEAAAPALQRQFIGKLRAVFGLP